MPEESYTIPFGEANIVREGGDVTIVAIGRMVQQALEAADELARRGIECEIIDPRTTSPLDTETIFESVENTGRLVVVDEANPRCCSPRTSRRSSRRSVRALGRATQRSPPRTRRCRSRPRWRTSTSRTPTRIAEAVRRRRGARMPA